ncbi:carcinoembryonic antigen related cell adhesion molecule 1, partial [Ictidomys tridecemlineatus]|uniref:carcinoembryonic antigen-related cell adhesion molecule 1 n=1 Tax=Ictidomys tridecemlineatus TaxID=43179 RepID=UPI00038C534F
DAAEGTDVLLLVHNASQNTIGYNWFKGNTADNRHQIISYMVSTQLTTPGSAFSGREKIYSNGSLLIQNVTQNDTGFYAVQTITANLRVELATGEFRVHEKLPKPNITINNSQPMEGEDSLALTCEPEIHYATYLWKINNQMILDGDRLKLFNNNRTLTLFNVTRNDTGPYECEIQNPVSASRSDPLTLNISYGPDAPIINPPESHFRSGTNLNLSCHADSNPPAQYSWSFNGRPLESTQELSILNLSTNNSGSYVCVAHNSVTNLNRTTTKNITISEPLTSPHLTASNTTVAEGDSVELTCIPNDTEISIQWLFNNKILQLTDTMQLSLNNSILTINPVKKTDEGEYHCQVSNQVFSEKSNPITLTVIAGPGGDDIPGGPVPDGLSPGAIAGIVIGVLAGVGLIAGLGYFLFFRKTGRASDQHDLTEHIPSASNHSPDPSDHSPDKGDDVAYSSLNFNIQELTQPSSPTSPSPTATETVYSELKKK